MTVRPRTFLLLQVRNPGDVMREHEARCFAAALGCGREQVVTYDLIAARPSMAELQRHDAVLIGAYRREFEELWGRYAPR